MKTNYQKASLFKKVWLNIFWSVRLFPSFVYEALKYTLYGLPADISRGPVGFSWIVYRSRVDYYIGNCRLLQDTIDELQAKLDRLATPAEGSDWVKSE